LGSAGQRVSESVEKTCWVISTIDRSESSGCYSSRKRGRAHEKFREKKIDIWERGEETIHPYIRKI